MLHSATAPSPLPRFTLHPGEFGVWPRNELDLHVDQVRDGVVAVMKVYPTHVGAAYFVSALDLQDNVAAFLQAGMRVRPRRPLQIELHYRPVGLGRRRHSQNQPRDLARLMADVFVEKEPTLAEPRLLRMVPFEQADTDFRLRNFYGYTHTEACAPYPWAQAPAVASHPRSAHLMRNITP